MGTLFEDEYAWGWFLIENSFHEQRKKEVFIIIINTSIIGGYHVGY